MPISTVRHASSRVALSAVAALALVACGSSGDGGGGSSGNGQSGDGTGGGQGAQPSANVYDFTQGGNAVKDSLTIKLPAKLKTTLGARANSVLVESFTLKPRTIDGGKYCGADVTIAYANGGQAKLAAPIVPPAYSSTGQEGAISKIKGRSTDLKQVAGKLRSQSPNEATAVYSMLQQLKGDSDESIRGAASQIMDTSSYATTDALIDDVLNKAVTYFKGTAKAANDEAAKSTGGENVASQVSGYRSGGTFDPTDPSRGLYPTSDASKFILVQECGVSPVDDVDNVDLEFPESGELGIGPLARAQVTIMKDGTMAVRESKVIKFEMDSNGDWIAK